MRLGCKICKLGKGCATSKISGNGSPNPVVLFVGEAPGAEEDEQGIPFVGQSGKLLRRLADIGNDNGYEVRYTNLVRCRPHKNAAPEDWAIKACKPFLDQEILETNPRIIVPLGSTASAALVGNKQITKIRGRKIVKDGRIYFPMFHPAYILRNRNEEPTFISDMSVLFSGDLFDEAEVNVRTVSLNEAYEYLKDAKEFSFDIETTGFDPYSAEADILCIGFSKDGEEAICVDVRNTRWRRNDGCNFERETLQRILCSKIPKIAQNGKFDVNYIEAVTGIRVKNFNWDTRLMYYVLDENASHGLKNMVTQFLPKFSGYEQKLLPYLKSLGEDNDTTANYSTIPQPVLHEYCGTDALVTFKLKQQFEQELLEEQDLYLYYREIIHPVSEMLGEVEHRGCKVDLEAAQDLDERLKAGLAQVEEKLLQHEAVEKFNHKTKKIAEKLAQAEIVVAGFQKRLKPKDRKDNEEYAAARAERDLYKKQVKSRAEINFNSAEHKAELLYTHEKLGVKAYTETGKRSVSKKQIVHMDNDLARLLLERNRMATLRSRYAGDAVKAWVHDDGLVHTQFNFVDTGRLSSKNPNLQQMPRESTAREFEVKRNFVSKFENGVIISADYSQIELRIFGVLAECQAFLDIFATDGDIHQMVADELSEMLGRDFFDNLKIKPRDAAKTVNFGIIYGETEKGMSDTHGWPIDKCTTMLQRYMKRYPEIRDYRRAIKQELEHFGFVKSPLYARRRFPDYKKADRYEKFAMERQACNHPIQHAASALNTISGLRIRDHFRKSPPKGKLLTESHITIFIHDQIVIDTAPDEIDYVLEAVNTIMPHPDMPWLTVKTPVEVKLGTSFGEMETV